MEEPSITWNSNDRFASQCGHGVISSGLGCPSLETHTGALSDQRAYLIYISEFMALQDAYRHEYTYAYTRAEFYSPQYLIRFSSNDCKKFETLSILDDCIST